MLSDWPVLFPDNEPVAHRLRAAFPSRWVRFHSLPGSKRYPDDDSGFVMVLGRYNRVLDELVGPGAKVVLLTTEYSGPPGTDEVFHAVPEMRTLDPDAKPWRTVSMQELDEDFHEPSFWHVLASECSWRPGIFDPILRLVADNLISNVMILHPGCNWLFHPYDGGMDLILESQAALDRIESSHTDWLSTRPDGL